MNPISLREPTARLGPTPRRTPHLALALALAPLLALMLAGGLVAGDEGYWQPGTGVQVGGVYFHVVSVAPNTEALFRVTERLDAEGLEDHPDCYRVSRTFYHLESCPLVQEHFRRHAESAGSNAPQAAPVDHSGGEHPINYVQGNYQPRQAPYWSTGYWSTPWLGFGPGYGYSFTRPGHGFGRPGFRPGVRPPYRPGFGPGHRGGGSFRSW
jgi:hypothetical protein